MPMIFISFRTRQSGQAAGRIALRLRERFGDGVVFKDTESIAKGADLEAALDDALEHMDAMVVVVGPEWNCTDLNDDSDYVRREVMRALQRNLPIVPAFVDGAGPEAMKREKLPKDFRALAVKNGQVIRHGEQDFRNDIDVIARCLAGHLGVELQPVDAREPSPPARRTMAPAEAITAWRDWGLDRYGHVRIVGFQNTHQISIELDRVFVPLYVHADRARKGTGRERRDDPDAIGELGGDISLDDALDLASDGRTRLALIGYPGAGKTTLLHHLYRRVATGDVDRVPCLRGMFPVLVRLSSVTGDELCERGLARVVTRAAREAGYPEAAAALLASRQPAMLFLLDGLDEVRDEATRKRICDWLDREVDHWRGCGFVVTSRPGAWARTRDLAAKFRPVWLQGFGRAAIAEYVGLWFAAVEHHFRAANEPAAVVEARARAKATVLLGVLSSPTWRSSARLLEMATNPLLLSTLCLVHHADTRLPEQRGELYDRALGLLIEVWTGKRVGGPVLRSQDVRLVLQPLAHAMHERDLRELPVDEAATLVRAPLAEVPALRTVAPTAERFLDLVRDECGVLASRDLGTIEFVHLSFQEYLAAGHVAERGLAGALADRVADPRWEEVILLAMSMLGVFTPFMTAALARPDVDAHHALLRKCIGEARRLDPAPFEAAADRWLALIGQPAAPPSPSPVIALRRLFELVAGYDLPGLVERARTLVDDDRVDADLRDAARKLVGIAAPAAGAPRPGTPFVEPATGMRFLWIPGGSFVMGSSKEKGQPNFDPQAYQTELPAHPVQLTGFWMAEHPVTNEQYQRFVAETGRDAPRTFGDRRFNDPAQPVVAVDWADARAFTAWLGAKLAPVGARLPTEAEWEYAARGTDGRKYPWGDADPDAWRATFGQPSNGRPSMVGWTPAGKSPFGVQDLAGNVWEWCLDDWRDNYRDDQPTNDPCHVGDPRVAARVVRGGSWGYEPRDLRCACRNGNRPLSRGTFLGFRVVVGGSRQHAYD